MEVWLTQLQTSARKRSAVVLRFMIVFEVWDMSLLVVGGLIDDQHRLCFVDEADLLGASQYNMCQASGLRGD